MTAPLLRPSILAGRWFDSDAQRLRAQVRDFIDNGATRVPWLAQPQAASTAQGQPWGLLLPHAGHVYCGNVMGATLKGVRLPDTLVIICPNHTGRGQPFGVWPSGAWQTPLGDVLVNDRLATALTALPPFAPDVQCHAGEHSIEVILPFLQEHYAADGRVPAIVPVCVGTQHFAALTQAGEALAQALQHWQEEEGAGSVGVIVSSDMNHFASEEETRKKDELALNKALAADPRAFLATIQAEQISMCGAGPLTLALTAMHCLTTPPASPRVEVVCHDTSASASGDSKRVVGYAGLRLFVE